MENDEPQNEDSYLIVSPRIRLKPLENFKVCQGNFKVSPRFLLACLNESLYNIAMVQLLAWGRRSQIEEGEVIP